ncbi:hypothetical protein GCM10023187_48180 [Nibrella viscosa]|uniref:Outer membrane protein beta-barrel domain-containing protein n=1 Tax=Nibrella viscosa TaxID=1084524 RepID=A0ABP8KTZ5_9BACT
MKTDKFDDSIRRKLESIEPAFREKDWNQMQAYMHQHAPGSALPGAARWVVPSAAAAAIVTLLVTTIWQYRTNQELRQSVTSLNQSLTEMQELHADLQNRVDTVYITKYVPAPAIQRASEAYASRDNRREAELPTRPALRTMDAGDDRTGEQADLITSRPNRTGNVPSGDNTDIIRTTPDGAPTMPFPNNPIGAEHTDRRRPASADVEPGGTPDTGAGRATDIPDRTDRYSRTDSRAQSRKSGTTDNNRPYLASGQPTTDRQLSATSQPAAGTLPTTDRVAEFAWLNVQPLNSRSIIVDSAYYRERFDRRSRKIRSLLPVPKYAPAEAVAAEPSTDVKLRIGGSTALGVGQWSGGLYGEALFGQHVTLGIGLTRLNIAGGKFLTDIQFNNDKKRDFRREYANGIDPRHEILNINQHSITWQVPVNLGYRVPLLNGLALTPTVGMSLSLNAKEVIAFTYRRAPGEFNEVQLHANRPTQWFNSWTLAVAAEKQWKNLVFQASPYYSKPFTNTPLGLTSSAAGLRVRVLYQF